jgi:hypothetical protein
MLVEIVLCCVVLHIFQMEGEVSRVKRARMLSQNQIQNIVMDSNSNEEAYYVSTDTEDVQQPCPSLPISKPASPDYSASSSEDEGDVNVAGRQPQPSQWTLPPKPRRHVVHTPKGKSSEAAHITSASTPLSVLLLFFAEIITVLVLETNRYYQQFLDSSDEGPPPQHEVTEAEMFAFLAMTLQMGHTFKHRQKWNNFPLHSMDKRRYVLDIFTYYAFCISRTMIGMELTGQMIDCGKYETCLKL